MALRSSGMSMPVEFKPLLGQYYYPFIDAVSHNTGVAAFGEAAYFGRWWIDAERLGAIRRHAKLTGDDLADVAKYYLALPYEWGDHRRLVRAQLVRPLRAWRGKGLPAHDARSGTRFIPRNTSRWRSSSSRAIAASSTRRSRTPSACTRRTPIAGTLRDHRRMTTRSCPRTDAATITPSSTMRATVASLIATPAHASTHSSPPSRHTCTGNPSSSA